VSALGRVSACNGTTSGKNNSVTDPYVRGYLLTTIAGSRSDSTKLSVLAAAENQLPKISDACKRIHLASSIGAELSRSGELSRAVPIAHAVLQEIVSRPGDRCVETELATIALIFARANDIRSLRRCVNELNERGRTVSDLLLEAAKELAVADKNSVGDARKLLMDAFGHTRGAHPCPVRESFAFVDIAFTVGLMEAGHAMLRDLQRRPECGVSRDMIVGALAKNKLLREAQRLAGDDCESRVEVGAAAPAGSPTRLQVMEDIAGLDMAAPLPCLEQFANRLLANDQLVDATAVARHAVRVSKSKGWRLSDLSFLTSLLIRLGAPDDARQLLTAFLAHNDEANEPDTRKALAEYFALAGAFGEAIKLLHGIRREDRLETLVIAGLAAKAVEDRMAVQRVRDEIPNEISAAELPLTLDSRSSLAIGLGRLEEFHAAESVIRTLGTEPWRRIMITGALLIEYSLHTGAARPADLYQQPDRDELFSPRVLYEIRLHYNLSRWFQY
jgi:hypothetical protein